MTIEEYIIHGHEKVNGWFSPDAMRIIKAFSDIQNDGGIHGDILEIGVYQGKSAIFLSMLLNHRERLHAVDPFMKDNLYYGLNDIEIFKSNIQQFNTQNKIDIFCTNSDDFFTHYNDYHDYRFVHIDGCHLKKNVIHDLHNVSENLADYGLIIVDDLFNQQHPGVMEGFIHFTFKYDCYPLIIGHNKLIFAMDIDTYKFYKDKFKPEIFGNYIKRDFIDTETIIFI